MQFFFTDKAITAGPKCRAREAVLGNRPDVGILSREQSSVLAQRTAVIDYVYPDCSQRTKELLLRPDIFPVLLGIKGAYVRYKGDPPVADFMDEIFHFPEVYATVPIIYNDKVIFNTTGFPEKLRNNARFVSENTLLTTEQLMKLTSDVIDEPWANNFMEWMLSNHMEEPYNYATHGFVIGYPVDDILYSLDCYRAGRSLEPNKIVNLFGLMALGADVMATVEYMYAWQEAMKFGYMVLSRYPGFWDDFDAAVSPFTKHYTMFVQNAQ